MDARDDVVRLSVNLPRREAEALKLLADSRVSTVTEVVRDAIATERYMEEKRQHNAEFLVKIPGEPLERVQFRNR